jgi:predicted amidohydrolase YtcJ
MAGVLFRGGAIFTGDRARPWVDAVLIDGDRVVAVEPESVPTGTEPFDLDGDTLIPGFVDAHNHVLATGESLGSLDLRYPGIGSAEDLLDAIRRAASDLPADAALTGAGLDTGKFALPALDAIDRAADGRPVFFHHISGHAALVDSASFAAAGIPHDVADPAGGRFDRDADGRLTGMCFDAAMGRVMPTAVDVGSHGPNFHVRATTAELVDAAERAGRAFLAEGLTTACDAQVTVRELAAYRAARDQGRLRTRTVCMPLSHQLDAFRELGLAGPFGDDLLSIGHLKIYADGTLTGGTAAFGADLAIGSQTGSWYHPPGELSDLIAAAWADGWRIGVHAQGDAAIGAVLDGFQRAAGERPLADARPRIEHAGFPRAEGVARMAALDVTAVTQPTYLHDFGDEYLASLGDLGHDLQPWRDLLDAGVRVVISSDSDVTTYRPLDAVANAMRRRTRSGAVLGDRHRLTLEEALFAHTTDAAHAVGMEGRVGTLAAGAHADLAVIGGDLRAMSGDDIAATTLRATFLSGEPQS